MSKKVFISYRREDSRYQAREIYEAFCRALPAGTVFMDVDSIPPGADFVSILEGWVKQCDILLALIGPGWLKSLDPRTGLPRLENPLDFVRIEICGALARDIPVVPVLVDTDEVPLADQLPEDMRALPRRHAQFVSFRTFDTDVAGLIARLRIKDGGGVSEQRFTATTETVPASSNVSREPMRARQAWYKISWLRLSLAALAVLSITAVLALTWRMAVGLPPADVAATVVRSQDFRAELEKSEKARREAVARAEDAASELAKAKDAFTKSEKARQDAEALASATAAELNKTQTALTNSETAQRDAEARASAAAAEQAKAQGASAKSEKARQDAEARASAAVAEQVKARSALAISEQARQQAEARTAEAVAQKASAEERVVEARMKRPTASVGLAGSLLSTFSSNIWWAFNDAANCGNQYERYSLEVTLNSLTWRHRGTASVESIDSNNANEVRTTTQSSTSAGTGQRWVYSRNGNAIQMQAGGGQGTPSILYQCP